ncbi:MAG: tRNA 2-selenouridine(34) synthase MnmH, partial [Burkholderiales bacterium]|nr:tRNA 2-selenouridine(34) synthase MnmH [Burkholderiales bacterium]
MLYPLPSDLRADLSQLTDCDEIIDARTPAEFAIDHLPDARNCPVLSNAQRHEIGLLYANAPFDARKIGSAMVA